MITLDVFGLDGLLLASLSRTGRGILSISQANIHGFVFYHNNYGWNGIDDIIGFDDIVFNDVTLPGTGPDPDPDPDPIPEPATIALLGIGLVGLAGAEVRRRRKKKAADRSQ